MNYLDGLILVTLLLAAIKGYRQGFIKAAAGLIGTIFAIFLAWQWSPSLAVWLDEQYNLHTVFGDWLFKVLPIPQTVAGINPEHVTMLQVGEILPQTGLPLALREGLVSYWESVGLDSLDSLGNAIAQGLGAMLLKAVAFAVLAAVLIILLRLAAHLLTAGLGHTVLGGANRLAGLVLRTIGVTVVLGLVLNMIIPILELGVQTPEVIQSSLLIPKLMSIYGIFATFIYHWI